MVSSCRPSENRPPNFPSKLVKPVFNSRRYLTHTQDKYKNCARHLVRTLKRMSALEGRVYAEIYLRQEKFHCLWKVFFGQNGKRWENWLPDEPNILHFNETKWCTYWLKLPRSGGMSVDFIKCNIRIPSVSITSKVIKMPAVEWLPHKVQASLLGLQLFTLL